MSYEPPMPPSELPTDIVDSLNGYSPDRLRNVARYAEAVAERKEREACLEVKSDQSEVEEQPDDLPADVPSKATITIRAINDNRYSFWHWRDGDQIRSEYKAPVNPDE